jgi:hypothetical protein
MISLLKAKIKNTTTLTDCDELQNHIDRMFHCDDKEGQSLTTLLKARYQQLLHIGASGVKLETAKTELVLTTGQKQLLKAYIVNAIDCDELDSPTLDRKIEHIKTEFFASMGWQVKRDGLLSALEAWVRGMPSQLDIKFYNGDVLELMQSYRFDKPSDTLVDDYWKALPIVLSELFKDNRKSGEKVNASYIKLHYTLKNPNDHFFDRKSMRFFGDTMANYAANNTMHHVETYSDGVVECYMLRRKKPVKNGLSSPAFFSVDSFELIHSKG